MSTDDELRNLLAARADSQTITVSPLDDITATGDRSVRRNRVLGGFGVVAFLLLGVLGIAQFGGPEGSTTMFAGLDEDQLVEAPTTLIATADGFLGAIVVADPDFDPDAPGAPERPEHFVPYTTTSTDGEEWTPAESTGLVASTPRFQLAEHDGRYWLAHTLDGAVRLAFSDDRVDWTEVDLPEMAGFRTEPAEGTVRQIWTHDLVASDAGVLLAIRQQDAPDIERMLDPAVEYCGIVIAEETLSTRACGQTEWTETESDLGSPSLAFAPPTNTLVFSADGDQFEAIQTPDSEDRPRFSSGQALYEIDGGFGLADWVVRESTDGQMWKALDIERLSSPSFVAARGDERVASRDSYGLEVEVMFSPDGAEFTSVDLSELLQLDVAASSGDDRQPPILNPRFRVTDLIAGDAGWVLHGYTLPSSPYPGAPDAADPEPLSVDFGGHTLHALAPAGPARLENEAGEIVAEWDGFEVSQPWRSGAIEADGRLILNDADGEALASIALAEWRNAVGNQATLHVVLFSADGMAWEILHEHTNFGIQAAIGDDEVVLVTQSMDGPSAIRFPVLED